MSRISNGSSIVSLVDRSVGYGILGAGARMGAGLVTVSVVALTLTKEEQGCFFTFFSVLGLRVFVELGLGQVLVQFASHEFAKLRLTPQQGLEGDAEALSRLTSLGRSAIKWFFCGTFVFVVVAVCAGGMFFDGTPSDVDWLGPWVVLCGLTGLRILLTPIWSILEGCNRVEQIYRFRFFDVICSSVALWVALGFGVGLWALVAST